MSVNRIKNRCLTAVIAVFLAVTLVSIAWAEKVPLKSLNGRMVTAPLFVVGTYDTKGRPDIAVIDRAGIASSVGSDKAYIFISVLPKRQTAKNIDSTKAFTINIPSTPYVHQANFTGLVSAVSGDRYIDKFKTTGLLPLRASKVNAPMVKEFPVSMECRVIKTKSFGEGSHTMYIAQVMSVWIDETVLNPAGSRGAGFPDPLKLNPLLYYQGSGGGYYKLGQNIGKPQGVYKAKYPDSLKK